MQTLPTELHEHILSYLPFPDLIRLRRVSHLYNNIIFHLLSHPQNLSSWTITLTTSSGTLLSIPLDHTSTRPANSWSEIYRRPYIFSGPITGIHRADHAQVLKFHFWDRKRGDDAGTWVEECRYRCCGLCDVTLWPWSTLPVCRMGPLGEVIRWRDLYKVELWESQWDARLLRQKRRQQHIGAPFHLHPQHPQVSIVQVAGQAVQGVAAVGPPIIPVNGFVSIFMGQAIQMTENGQVAVPGIPGTSFSPNRARIAMSYSAICGFLVVQRRMEEDVRRQAMWGDQSDPVALAVQDPKMRELAFRARVGCGCKLVDWEREDLGIKIIRLDESEANTFERFK